MRTIEVFSKEGNARDKSAKEAMLDAGIKADSVKVSDLYYIEGYFSDNEIKKLADELFADKLTQEYKLSSSKRKSEWIAEVRYMDNVDEPAEDSIKKAVKDFGMEAKSVRTAKRYYIRGKLSQQDIGKACRKVLANDVVESHYYGYEELEYVKPNAIKGNENTEIKEASIIEAGEDELKRISRDGLLSLSLEEMKAIQQHFRKERRNPTDCELETIAQTWSEHCKHKTFNSEIEFTEISSSGEKTERIGNLFKETIVAATEKAAKKKDWLISVFKDNAGIIKIDGKNNFAFKVETHNHPSALDPYGGAATGIGGVIRDVLGAGLGAKPIFNTDVFCFANPGYEGEVPEGVMHPRRTFKGVVSGVRDYGNRMGIPTVNGAIVFHDGFLGAPLVFCGTGGIIPKGMEKKKANAGDLIVVVGGKTGRDGLHGATFSSAVLDEKSSTSAVQIGNPIEEKRIMDALLKARDRKLYNCITDCGAGGFSSAIGEMARETGAEVELEKAPLKYGGMKPWEIWLSESQERMIIAVPLKNIDELMEICSGEDVTAAAIGKFTGTGRLAVKYKGKKLVDMDMKFLHEGLPKQRRKAVWQEKKHEEPELKEKENYNGELKRILAHPTVASKEEVIRRYDFEVQGNTVGKPMTGAFNDGPSDAAVIRIEFSDKAIIVANGINPRYSMIDSYWMAASAIDEALRNIVSSGGEVGRTAMLDNFCWASVNDEKMGSLVRAAKACYDMATGFEVPFISGKDSLHNEFRSGSRTIAIPDTLLISAACVTEKLENTVSMDLKETGSSIYIVGKTYDELGGSYYYGLLGKIGRNVPKVRLKDARKNMEALTKAMRKGLVLSCHDCSEGGIAVAAAEMAFAGNIGMKIDAARIPNEADKNYKLLFSESNSRFLVEVRKGKEKEFEGITGAAKIGHTTNEKKLIISNSGGELINAEIDELKNAWKGTIKW